MAAVGHELPVAQLDPMPLHLDHRDALAGMGEHDVDLVITLDPSPAPTSGITSQSSLRWSRSASTTARSSSLARVRSEKSSGTSSPTATVWSLDPVGPSFSRTAERR